MARGAQAAPRCRGRRALHGDWQRDNFKCRPRSPRSWVRMVLWLSGGARRKIGRKYTIYSSDCRLPIWASHVINPTGLTSERVGETSLQGDFSVPFLLSSTCCEALFTLLSIGFECYGGARVSAGELALAKRLLVPIRAQLVRVEQ